MNPRDEFWKGEFGNAYNLRSPGSVEANKHFFHNALLMASEHVGRSNPKSVVELGCGMGTNLLALHSLMPQLELAGVEVNEAAAYHTSWLPIPVGVMLASILDWTPQRQWDLAFTKGVLIHIAPEDLPRAYAALYRASSRYILVAEYYNPKPVEVPYRGHAGRLWKRDFAGELLDAYPDLSLIDYGFVYHRDQFPQDDLNWFLLEKRGDHGKAGSRTAAT